MAALIIIAIIILIIAVLLFVPLKLKIALTEEFDFDLSYFGFKINLKPKEQTAKSPEKSQNDLSSPNNAAKKDNFLKQLYREKEFSEFCSIIFDFLKTVLLKLKYVLKHTKVNQFDCNIKVASNDAAKTGIQYGIICTILYNFLEFLENIVALKIKNIKVNADFEDKKPEIKLLAEINIQPFYLIIAAIIVLKKYVNIKGEVLK